MKIAGLQKMTLLDFPGKVACTVFLPGCNFRCPFCHNSGLIGQGDGEIPVGELMAFLQKRRGLLDGVCITGGEPTLQKDLKELISQIKEMGYLVKLDTNGSHPEVLKALASEKLLDYVAMDIKNSPARYAQTAGMSPQMLKNVEESAAFLLTGSVDYEFRTTVADELHTERDIAEMGRWLHGLAVDRQIKRFFIQPYADRDSVLQKGLHTPDAEKLGKFVEILRAYANTAALRGTD